jgi:hypothetical protein
MSAQGQPPLVDSIVDGKHTRANVALVCSQLHELGAKGLPVPQQLLEALPHVVAKLMKSDSPRIQNAGAKLLLAMLRHNLDVVQVADRMTRADAAPEATAQQLPVKFIRGVDPEALT